jgi:hypothetical protein
MKIFLGVALAGVLLFLNSGQAATTSFSKDGFDVTIEPIVGYNFSHSDTPTPHFISMLIYGARVTAGHKLLAAEGEFTRGSSNEGFTNPTQTVTTTKDNVKLGLRSSPPLTSWMSILARAGGQASRQKIETNQSGTSTTENGTWEIRPYAGTGLQISLAQNFSLAAEATYVFNDLKDWSRNDIQTTLSLKIDLKGFHFLGQK